MLTEAVSPDPSKQVLVIKGGAWADRWAADGIDLKLRVLHDDISRITRPYHSALMGEIQTQVDNKTDRRARNILGLVKNQREVGWVTQGSKGEYKHSLRFYKHKGVQPVGYRVNLPLVDEVRRSSLEIGLNAQQIYSVKLEEKAANKYIPFSDEFEYNRNRLGSVTDIDDFLDKFTVPTSYDFRSKTCKGITFDLTAHPKLNLHLNYVFAFGMSNYAFWELFYLCNTPFTLNTEGGFQRALSENDERYFKKYGFSDRTDISSASFLKILETTLGKIPSEKVTVVVE